MAAQDWVVATDGPGPNGIVDRGEARAAQVEATVIVTVAGPGTGTRRGALDRDRDCRRAGAQRDGPP